jgi:hypothetical protein
MAAIGKDALWQQGRDETVEVNQRALIDKVSIFLYSLLRMHLIFSCRCSRDIQGNLQVRLGYTSIREKSSQLACPVFRELLQNADDARATSAEIRFDTKNHLSQQAGEAPDAINDTNSQVAASTGGIASRKPPLPDLKKAFVSL